MEKVVENMNWYVLRVIGGKERKTVEFLEKEIDRLDMHDFEIGRASCRERV